MLKRKVTVFLIGLMCLSSVSGFLTVICHGFDGHATIEPVVHNHCECPETAEFSSQDKNTRAMIELSTDHDHCSDTIVISNVVAPARQKVKQSIHKILTTTYVLKSGTADTASGFSLAKHSKVSSSFHTPLRTIIILA